MASIARITIFINTRVYSWVEPYLQRRLLVISLLNFSAGIPVLLKAGTLSAWLADKGVDYTTIGLFGIVGLPYSFRFVLAPFVDRMPIPYLSKRFGQRRSWMICSQVSLILALASFATFIPSQNILLAFVLTFLVSILGAIQWIVVLAYQMETLPKEQYGPGEGAGILGYRVGMNLVGGYLALVVAHLYGWGLSYLAMSLLMGVGLLTSLSIREPRSSTNKPYEVREAKIYDHLRHNTNIKDGWAVMLAWFHAAVWCPFSDFMKNKGWVACLMVMFFYRFGDNLIGNMSNVFYLDLGFSKLEIANASKLFGMVATVFGGLIGGVVVAKFGFLRSMLWCTVIHGIANLMYVVMFYIGHDVNMLKFAIAVENITGGMRMSALLAYQMVWCTPIYAATQIALLGSMVSLGHHLVSPLSGWLIETIGWVDFFCWSVLATLPAVFIILYLIRLAGEGIFYKKSRAYLA